MTTTTLDLTDLAQRAVEKGAQQKPTELQKFSELLVSELPQREHLIEIGGGNGSTAWLWAQLFARVTVVDIAPAPEGLGGRVSWLDADSHAQATVDTVRRRCGEADCVFIDGDHTAAGVRQDFAMWTTLVRPRGLLALHDIVQDSRMPEIEVWQLWDELRRERPSAIVADIRDGTAWYPPTCGFGVIRPWA